MSYDNLINEILKDYKGLGFTQCMSRPMSIGKPLFQYKETDYEFLKRVASLLGLEVICDIINWNNMFYFGRPEGKKYELEDEINYKACKDLERYYKARTRGFGVDFHDTDFFYYEVENRVKMDIGDKIYFKQKDLYVSRFEAKLHQGELIYKYRFCRKDGIWQDKIYTYKNGALAATKFIKKIKGISLEGRVLEAKGEKVKLHLNIDKSQDPSKAAWFYYAPPTGNILYSMPIVGESATLYFQDEIDAAPIVTGCVRKNGSTCAKLSDTANRYFATESGNYLDMLPGSINFYRSGFNINLNDKNGITLSIGASGSVNLSAGSVSINATSKLLVQKNKSSYISLENEFYAKASAVYENGSDRQSNPKFADDEPTAGVAEALAKKLAESLKFNNGLLASTMAGSGATAKACIVPASKDSVPLEGEDLKNRDDIPTFDTSQTYGEGTIVKYQSLDGEYILGKTNTLNNPYGPDTSTFTPIDKDSYSEHNSVADEYKSIGLGAADSVQQATFGVGELATYGWQGLNVGTGAISYGYEKIFGVSPFGGMLEYKPEIWEGLREDCEKLSSACHNYLENLAPHKNSFEAAKGITDLIMAMDGMRGMVGSIKNIPKIFSGGIKVVGFANGALTVEKILNLNIAGIGQLGGSGLITATSINNIIGNSSSSNASNERVGSESLENSNDKSLENADSTKNISENTNQTENVNETGKANSIDKGGSKAYTGGRTKAELEDLARDPSHAGRIEEQGIKEREVGLALEERGDLGNIVRDTQIDKGAEFIDTTTGLKWDVKSFESYPMGRNGIPITKVKKGAFSVEKGMEKIYGEFDKGNNVIIDKRLLTPEHIEQLKEAIKEAGIGDRIIWYP